MRNLITFLTIFFNCLIIHGQQIIDNGQFFSNSELTKLKTQIEEVKKTTTVDILIYSVIDLKGQSAKEFGMDLAKKIPVGFKGINNGILIVLSKNDRTFQILTEYGLEWVLTDEICKNISNRMLENFKNKEFYNGLELAIRLIKEKVSKCDWRIEETNLNKLTKTENGKVIKFIFSNNTNNRKFKYAIETDPQFNEEFKIRLKSKDDEFDLYYSKYMNDFIGNIISRKEITIYARLKDYDSRKLELLGIE